MSQMTLIILFVFSFIIPLKSKAQSQESAYENLSSIVNIDGLEFITIPQQSGDSEKLAIIPPQKRITDHYHGILDHLFFKIKENGGSNNLDWLDINQLSMEIKDVKIYVNNSKEALLGSGVRRGSVYLTEQKTAILNSGFLLEIANEDLKNQPINIGFETMLMHEHLGALGYPDDNYEISTYLWIRTQPKGVYYATLPWIENSLKQHLKQNTRRTENIKYDTLTIDAHNNLVSGGSSGFGGGGDPFAAMIKIYALGNISVQKNYWSHYFKLSQMEENILPSLILFSRLESLEALFLNDKQKITHNIRKKINIFVGKNKTGEEEILFTVQPDNIIFEDHETLGKISIEYVSKLLFVYRTYGKVQ